MKDLTLSAVSGQTRPPVSKRFTSSEFPEETLPKYETPISVSERNCFTSESRFSVDVFVMKPTISSLADRSSVLDERRAKISHLEDIGAMVDTDWRKRLIDAIDKSGRSMREISLKARKGPGYLHSILKEGKDPTIDNLIDICGALNVSLSSIIQGVEMTRESEEILRLLEGDPDARSGILQILSKR